MTKHYLTYIKLPNSTITELISLSKEQSIVGFLKDFDTKTLKLTIASENVHQVINTIQKNKDQEKAPIFDIFTNFKIKFVPDTTSDYKLSELKNAAAGQELILYFTVGTSRTFVLNEHFSDLRNKTDLIKTF